MSTSYGQRKNNSDTSQYIKDTNIWTNKQHVHRKLDSVFHLLKF